MRPGWSGFAYARDVTTPGTLCEWLQRFVSE